MTQPASDRDGFINDLVEENAHAIGQLIDFLEALPECLYRQTFGLRKQQVIGKHVRHIIDHYSALFAATEAPGAVLDYENRNRDLLLETDRRTASDRLSGILGRLRDRFAKEHSDGLNMLHASDDQRQAVDTSVARELAFLASHTIHHMAIIGLLAEQAGVEVDAEFGVHPSTLRYLQRQATGMVRSA